MKKFKHLWLAGLLLAATVGFTSCDDDDDNATSANPAEEFVTKNKKARHSHSAMYFRKYFQRIYQDLRSDVGRFRNGIS